MLAAPETKRQDKGTVRMSVIAKIASRRQRLSNGTADCTPPEIGFEEIKTVAFAVEQLSGGRH